MNFYQDLGAREMSEIKRPPIITYDASGNEVATFDADHSLADIARWICENPTDAEELTLIISEILAKTDGMVMQ